MSIKLTIMRVAPTGDSFDNMLSVGLNMAQASQLPNCTGDDVSYLPVSSLKVFDGIGFPCGIRMTDGSVEFWRAYTDAECAKYFNFYIGRANRKLDGEFLYGFFVRSEYGYRLDMCQHGASHKKPDCLVLLRWYRDRSSALYPMGLEEFATMPIPDNARRYPYGHYGRYKLHIADTLYYTQEPFRMHNFRKGVRKEIMRRLMQFSQTGYELVLTNSDVDRKIFMALEPFLDPKIRSQQIWDTLMTGDTILMLDWGGELCLD